MLIFSLVLLRIEMISDFREIYFILVGDAEYEVQNVEQQT